MSLNNPAAQLGPTIILVGDVSNGFRFIGPFEMPSEAVDWATDHCEGAWEAVSLETKEGYNGNGD